MASIDPLTVEQNERLKTEIEAGRHGQVRAILEKKYNGAHFTPAQVDLPRFPGNKRMIDLAISNARGKNGVAVIEKILRYGPTVSAKIFLMPQARKMHIYGVRMIIMYPSLKINDMTNTEKGQVLIFLTLIRQNETDSHDYASTDVFEKAIILASQLLTSGGIEQKYKNMALYYLKSRIANDTLIGTKLTSFRDLLLENGAVDIVPNAGNHTETQIQTNYKAIINSIAAKAAATAAKELEYQTKPGSYLDYLIGKNKYRDIVMAYLASNEFTVTKMNMARYRHTGKIEKDTLLQFAFYNSGADNYGQEVFEFLLEKPGIIVNVQLLYTLVMHCDRYYYQANYLALRVHMLISMVTSPFFTRGDASLDEIYKILEYSFNIGAPLLIEPLLMLIGTNEEEGGIDLYHVYGDHPDNFMTLYELAEKHYTDNDGNFNDVDGIVEMLDANGGNNPAKREAVKKARRRIYFIPILAAFNIPLEGPFRDGDPAVADAAKTASEADPTLWGGFTKVDEGELKMVFQPDYDSPAPKKNPDGTFALNPDGTQIMEITRIRPSLATTLCPVCLGFTVREAGCNYMHHKCIPENIIDIPLYNTYKIGEMIYWCTICNRVANDHGHFKVSNIFGPKPGSMQNNGTGDVFEDDCGHLGGGGLLEKIGRFHALREECKRLLPSIGTVKRKEARLLLGKAFWNAPLTNYLPIATALLASAGWANDPFPAVGAVLAEGPEPIYGMVGYNDAGGTLLPEVYDNPDAPKENSVSLEPINPAIQFRHIHPGKPEGHPVTHGDVYLTPATIFEFITNYGTNYGSVNFGKCMNSSFADCGAILHPREIEHILTTIMFDIDDATYDDYNRSLIKYRKAYNKKVGTGAIPPPPGIVAPVPAPAPVAAVAPAAIAAAIEGGGNFQTNSLKQNRNLNQQSRRTKNLSPIGHSLEFSVLNKKYANSNNPTFPVLDDTYCSVTLQPLKKLSSLYNPKQKTVNNRGGKRPRTIKRIKLRRRVTHSRPIHVVKKGTRKSKSHRQSGTRSKSRR